MQCMSASLEEGPQKSLLKEDTTCLASSIAIFNFQPICSPWLNFPDVTSDARPSMLCSLSWVCRFVKLCAVHVYSTLFFCAQMTTTFDLVRVLAGITFVTQTPLDMLRVTHSAVVTSTVSTPVIQVWWCSRSTHTVNMMLVSSSSAFLNVPPGWCCHTLGKKKRCFTNNCSTFRAPRKHFSPPPPLLPNYNPTLTLILLKYPYLKTKTFHKIEELFRFSRTSFSRSCRVPNDPKLFSSGVG